MNQKSRQQSKNDIEKDFYKHMNNSNFGCDCRNNLDNCKFVPIFDELKEIIFINRYHNLFDPKISEFVTADLLNANVEENFNNKLINLDKEGKFCENKLRTLKTERPTVLESAEKREQKNKKNKKRTKLTDFTGRKNEAFTNQNV